MKICKALLGVALVASLSSVSAVVSAQYWKNTQDWFSLNDVQVVEGEPAVFTIQVPEKLDFSVRWRYSTEDATAEAGSDYVGSQGTLQFAVGERMKTITIQTLADETAEHIPEFFQLQLYDMETSSDGVAWDLPGYIPGLPEYAATVGTIRDSNVLLSDLLNPSDDEKDATLVPESSDESSPSEDEGEGDAEGSMDNYDGVSGASDASPI